MIVGNGLSDIFPSSFSFYICHILKLHWGKRHHESHSWAATVKIPSFPSMKSSKYSSRFTLLHVSPGSALCYSISGLLFERCAVCTQRLNSTQVSDTPPTFLGSYLRSPGSGEGFDPNPTGGLRWQNIEYEHDLSITLTDLSVLQYI